MKKKIFLTLAAVALLLDSCSSYKKLTYLQDMETLVNYEVAEQPDVKISVNDKLSIFVTCQEPALAAPFNLQSGTFSVDPSTGEPASTVSSETSKGYLVDKNGCINFPVLGLVKATGYTLNEFRDLLVQMIIDTKYVKDPIVLVEFMNFQFTVLGEASPGNYNVPNGHINLLEAIAMAGDLATTAKRDDVWVIRTQNGVRTVYSVDMRSKSLYDSPAFYLQQNDVIYVKPQKSKRDSDDQRISNLWSGVTGGLSLISSLIIALHYAGVIGGGL